MSAPPQIRYVKNLEGLARLIVRERHAAVDGGKLSDNALARRAKKLLPEVVQWAQQPGFPAKGRQGWLVEEVLARCPGGQAPKLVTDLFLGKITPEEQKARLLAQKDKYVGAKATKQDILDLESAGYITPEEAHKAVPVDAAPTVDAESSVESTMYEKDGRTLRDCENQKALAIRLALHFKGRISIDISEQQISKWKTSPDELPNDVQPPPVKQGNRIKTNHWAEWIERFVLPLYPYQRSAQGTFPGVGVGLSKTEMERQQASINLEVSKLEYGRMTGAYGPKDAMRMARRGALMVLFNVMRKALEMDATQTRIEWLRTFLPPDVLLRFAKFDRMQAVLTVDRVQAEYDEQLKLEPEKQIVADGMKKI